MTSSLNIGQLAKPLLKLGLIALIFWFLVSQGVHPAWVVVLLIFRKTVFKVGIFLVLLYWLTSSIM